MELQQHCAPSDESLIDDYLRPKIAGKQGVGGDCVHDADVYSDHCTPTTSCASTTPRTAGFGISSAPRDTSAARTRPGDAAVPDSGRGRSPAPTARRRGPGTRGRPSTRWKAAPAGTSGSHHRETTPSGAIIKPGWMMVEYGIAEEHGGGDMLLCKVYKSSRGGPGSSDVSSRCALASSPARKRKADAVEHPEDPTRARQRQLYETNEEDDDAMSFAQMLEDELELLSYFKTENLPGGGEPAAPEYQDQPNDDDVMEISLDEFLGSSAARAVPPRAARTESAAAASCAQAPSPERSSTPSAFTDDDDMCGLALACPPMDDEYVELILSKPLVQFDPALIEEFINDQ
uniref:NAC domain-containing protein n=1 Tax=Setaria italica TaxID=4555 RepID=K4AM11_SETIT